MGRGGTVVLAGVTPRGNEVGVLRGTEPGAGTGTGTDADADAGTGADTGTGTGSAGEAGSAREAGSAGEVPYETLASLAEEPSVTPRPLHLILGERQLRGALFLPSWRREGAGKLPVLLDPYGGPAMQLVGRARGWFTCVSQWFAEQGFAVLVVDGRGTSNRGPAWEKTIHGDQLTPALEDQVDALRAAGARFGDLDLTRVAIRGWSFGGFLAAAAVLHHPDIFHAAVAACPAHRPAAVRHPLEGAVPGPPGGAAGELCAFLPDRPRPSAAPPAAAGPRARGRQCGGRAHPALLGRAAGGGQTAQRAPAARRHASVEAGDAVNEQLLHFQRDFLLDALERRVDGD